jgi:hypothetical protein
MPVLPAHDLEPFQRVNWQRIQRGEIRVLESVIQVPAGADRRAIVAAVRCLLIAHDGLRSRIVVTGGVLQQIVPVDEAVALAVSEQRVAQFPADLRKLPVPDIDIVKVCSLFTVFTAGDGRTLLQVAVAHVVTDHYGLQVAVRDLRTLLAGEPLDPVGRLRRGQISAAHRPTEFADNLQHWRDVLTGARSSRRYADPAQGPIRCAGFRLSAARTTRLHDTAQRFRTLPSVVVTAALSVVLEACTGEADQVFGCYLNSRRTPEEFASVGMYTSRVVTRLAAVAAERFAGRVARLHAAMMDGYRHARFDPAALNSSLAIQAGSAGPARDLFVVNYIEDVGGIDWDVVDMSSVRTEPQIQEMADRADEPLLYAACVSAGGDLQVNLLVRAALYGVRDAGELATDLLAVIDAAHQDPDVPVAVMLPTAASR